MFNVQIHSFYSNNTVSYVWNFLSDTLAIGADAQEQLDAMLLSYNFPTAIYNLTQNLTNFKASLTITVSGIIQKKLNHVTSMKQSDILQAAASEALTAVGQKAAGHAQNLLYGWCGRNGHSAPTYFPDSAAETTNYICVVSNAFEKNLNFEVESIWFQSEKEAIQAATELLLKIIQKTKLEEIWRSQGHFKPVTCNL